MKIVFFGSSDFALPSFGRLIKSEHDVLACVTQPDRKKGRHFELTPTPVKAFASSNGIRVYQPGDVKDRAFLKSVKALRADLFVVVAYGGILPGEILNIPKIYAINLHPSLLPKYRGAAPVNWAVIKGETKTGLSVIRMNEKTDAGDIILQRKVDIAKDDNAVSLNGRLAELGSVLLLDAIRFIELNKVKFKKQEKKAKILAPKLNKEDGLIDWKRPAAEINNMVRGLLPWPSAYTFLDGKMLKIYRSEIVPSYEKFEPGQFVELRKNTFAVACGQGLLIINELQLEGGKRMDGMTFLRGHKLEKGTRLGFSRPEDLPSSSGPSSQAVNPE